MKTAGMVFAVVAVAALPLLAEPAKEKKAEPVPAEAELEQKAAIDPDLDCELFKTVTTSRPMLIVEHDDGSLEDTGDGKIEEEDLLLIEHAADCIATSQGKHKERFCRAEATADGVEFSIYEPGYAGSLTVLLRADLSYSCSYEANYVTPGGGYVWKITKQSLRLKSKNIAARSRLYGWISVEFEEIDTKSGAKVPLKLEGFIKPVIQGGS